ncbi:PREDICTED: uncharacterized protein LOC105562199 [Vollenhovia emeryi]|uniref:uncharacterized protein LOC105562199 n=1 Tax=Vollenhovia emeryi TaxID=411798 RepID=UPI0005F3EC4A|nr:PREDICTED: uncharacterized protein LOC105562199 [Vollenhovia emeryi]
MSFGVVVNYLFVTFVVLVNGRPHEEKYESPPLIQFTDGGIRLNFGGYHAEAGLGGLLRGTGAGLYAGAGTPWGAHAGAGLGGQLGKNGNLGGGLYARAGLGRGGPEAAAGLGGKLDGTGRSVNPVAGGLYAGATPGGGPGPGVFLGGGLDGSGLDGIISGSTANEDSLKPPAAAAGATTTSTSANATSETKPPKGRTNIQIIRSRAQKEKEKVAAAGATLRADAPAAVKAESHNKETRRAVQVVPPAAEVGLVKSVYVGTAPAVKEVVVPTSAAAAPAQGAGQATATADTVTTVAGNPNVVVPKPVYPRWYFRKRFRTVPRKTVYVAPTESADSQGSPSDVVGGLLYKAVGDGGAVAAGKPDVSGSLFDDIFNIPISTLSAVNQLLRNNVG